VRLSLRVVPNAEREIRKAASWWQRTRPAAPDLFRAELHRGFELITRQPEVGPPALDVELSGVRRPHLSRIRYYLYYYLADDTIEVLGLWHTSRGGSPPL